MKLLIFFALLALVATGLNTFTSPEAQAKFDQIVKETGIDYSDRKMGWLAGAIQEHADRKNEPVLLKVGVTTGIMANYQFTPTQEKMEGLQVALKLKPGHCRPLDGTKICAAKTTLLFTPVIFLPNERAT